MDRSLVQMKQGRSSINARCWIAEATKTMAQSAVRRASGHVRITAPMKLVCLRGSIAAAGLVRNRPQTRPLSNRATVTNAARRSS